MIYSFEESGLSIDRSHILPCQGDIYVARSVSAITT